MPSHGVFFEQVGPELAKKLAVKDLSTSGISLVRSAFESWSRPGDRAVGILALKDVRIEVELSLVRSTPDVVAFRFIGEPKGLRGAIQSFFDSELGAAKMLEMVRDQLAQTTEGEPRYFRSTNGCELYFVVAPDGKVNRFELSFFGNYVEGGQGMPTRFGHEEEDVSESDRIRRAATPIIEWAGAMPEDLVVRATRFVGGIEAMGSSERMQIAELIDRVPRLG